MLKLIIFSIMLIIEKYLYIKKANRKIQNISTLAENVINIVAGYN